MLMDLYEYFAFETITITSTAKSLTQATYTDSDGVVAKVAKISVGDGGRVTYRIDGGIPTSSGGHIVTPMSTITILGQENVKSFRIIRTDASNGAVAVSYGR